MDVKKKILILLIFAFFCLMQNAFALVNLFYMLRVDPTEQRGANRSDIASLKNNYKNINILVLQAYQLDRNGLLRGSVDQGVVFFAAQNQIKLMPMITNAGFEEKVIHDFLHDIKGEARALESILAVCKANHYYGVQFDLEGINIEDREALNTFYRVAGAFLHKNGFAMSVTVVPQVPYDPNAADFQRLRYQHWSGAYDYKTLAESADFIVLMAYDQHGEGTTPGPVAALPWVEALVKHALTQIPAQKIFLGIPVYSDFWYMAGNPQGKNVRVHTDQISYDVVNTLLAKNNVKLQWDLRDKVPYIFYERDWLNQYIFAEDAKSFLEKYSLAQKYNLGGVAVWRLGMEDPGIWRVIGTNPLMLKLMQSRNKLQHQTLRVHN